MNMKKPVLGAIAVAGACAACCAIPLAAPLIAGMSAAGLAALIGWHGSTLSAIVIVVAGLGVALLAGAGLWRLRRPKAAACQLDTAAAASCRTTSCGCR